MELTTQPPSDYEEWDAETKGKWLWETLIGESLYPAEALPEVANPRPLDMARIALPKKTLEKTLDRAEDFMEPERPKIIHAQGAVAMVKLETFENSTYTGVLAPKEEGGGAIGLLRMSLAIRPKGKRAVTPGFGLKLLVDGNASLDLLAMNHTVGQGRDYNLMSNAFTHDLRDAHERLRPPQKFLQLFFKRVAKNPRWLSIEHFVAMDRTGIEIPKAERNAPKRLVFNPCAEVRRLFDGKVGEDFRETLGRVEAGTDLYSIDALPKGGGKPVKIGKLVATTPFRASRDGDRIFFRHVLGSDEDDPKAATGITDEGTR